MSKVVVFVKDSYSELKKVSWPTRKQVANYTVAVIISSIVIALFLGLLDILFSSVIEKFIFE